MITIIRHPRRRRRRPTMVLSAHALIVQLRVQVQVQVRVALIIILLCSSKLLLVCTSVQALPKGFVSEIVNPHTKAVTGVFAPNLRRNDHRPMMIVASKPGRVRVLENPENLNEDNDDSSSYTNKENADSNCDSNCDSNGDSDSDSDSNVILDLSGEGNMCDNGERGLTSIAIHPDFLETRWVYLYYTRWREGCLEDALLGPQNVLVRYTMNATTLLLENEELLLECGVLAGRVHNGGAMMFGTDGYLYLATGDGSSKSSVQDRTNLLGSLLRLNDDGSIPDTNPYAGKEKGVPCGKSNGVVVPPEINAIAIAIAIANGEENDDDDDDDVYFCSEIYSWGFRNPIRMALHHNKSNKKKVLFSISDVGAQQFEELSWAGTDFKEKNYGWPFLEGPCVPNSIDDCPLPSSFDDSNSNVVDPFHYYAHVSYENGGCVAGSAFVPEGTNWPEEYNYLFIDFILLKIYNLVEDPDAECRESCSPPTSRFINTTFYESSQEEGENINEARMIDMFFGPYKDTQALYVIKYGNNNSILRIRYIGLPPVAVIEAKNSNNNNNNQHQQQETEGTAGSLLPTALPNGNVAYSVGDAVKFDGSGSLDPDGGELTFQWDFGDRNDSTTNTTSPSPSHIYDEPGDYTVILVVTNSKDQAHLVSTTVLVIGKPPTAVMVSPMEGDIFTVGEVLRLNGEAYDYRGNRIPDDQLTWEVRGYHSDDGFDFFLEGTSGNDFDLNPVPEPRDFSPPEIMYLRVILFVTDDNGLITKIETDVYPNIVAIKLVAEPPQESMTIDGIAPTESPSMVEPVSNSTLPNETNIDSRPNPTIPNITSSMEDNIKLNLESGNTKLDKGQKKEENDSTYGMKPLEKWLIGICTTFLLIAPFYLGWKYYQLKCKLETDSTHSSSKEFQDKTSVPKNIEAISRKKEYTSTGNGDSVITNVSLSSSNISSSTSSASFSSSNVYSNRSAAIWEKIAEETERRTKLRAKYSSGIAVATTTPGTPETTETRESPSNLDSASSPSSDLSTNIDETLSRLDDLLEKCSTRKQARNARKQERNNFSFSSNQESLPGSPLREKNDDSLVEATFSMASLYSAGSLQDDSNESQVLNLLEVSNTSLNLPEVSNTSVQSLLIFQDNDLSMSYRASSIHDRDIHDDLMESGLVVDGDRTTTSDLVDIDECHSLVGNENDLDQYLG